MDTTQILHAGFLDILFDGKNKAYGAYELRKSYNKRISVSLVITFAIMAIVVAILLMSSNFSGKDNPREAGPGLVLKPGPPLAPPVLPPPPVVQRPHVATLAVLPPLIVKDNLVVEPPPDMQQIANAVIARQTTDGIKDPTFIQPPSDITGSQVVEVAGKKKIADSVFLSVEIDASFPGGAAAWTRYVGKAVEDKIDEFSDGDYGTCIVKFIVDKTGKVSQVEAVTMKNTKLAEIATNVIRKGPNWIPAQQNGSYVNAWRFQPVKLSSPN